MKKNLYLLVTISLLLGCSKSFETEEILNSAPSLSAENSSQMIPELPAQVQTIAEDDFQNLWIYALNPSTKILHRHRSGDPLIWQGVVIQDPDYPQIYDAALSTSFHLVVTGTEILNVRSFEMLNLKTNHVTKGYCPQSNDLKANCTLAFPTLKSRVVTCNLPNNSFEQRIVEIEKATYEVRMTYNDGKVKKSTIVVPERKNDCVMEIGNHNALNPAQRIPASQTEAATLNHRLWILFAMTLFALFGLSLGFYIKRNES